MFTLTGCLMVTAAIVYCAMQPATSLRIRFEDGVLVPVYGWAFWLAFSAGISSKLKRLNLLNMRSVSAGERQSIGHAISQPVLFGARIQQSPLKTD